MKTINDKLSKEKAQKEFKQFAIWGLVASVVSLLIFGWLGIVGLAFSARALLLSKHAGNQENLKLKQYRAMAIGGVIISVIDLAVVLSA
jgi:hypothetical protein